MTTEQLYEFLVLSKSLNYSKAASALYISQPLLTRHIQALEREFGAALFLRSSHGVSLTEAGRILASQAGGLIDKCSKAVNQLNMKNLPANGKIRIGCALEFSYANHLRTFQQQFMRRYPDVEISFEVQFSAIPENLMERYDILFTPCEYQRIPGNVRRELIMNQGTYAVLPHGHSLMAKSLVTLHQLAGSTLIVPYADEFMGPYAQNMRLVEKHARGHLNCIKVPNLPTALYLVSTGAGIIIAPRYVKNMVSSDIFVVGISDRSCRFPEYIYYIGHPGNGAAKLFYEEFRRDCIRAENPG